MGSCGTGVVALLEDCIMEGVPEGRLHHGGLESWRPGAWRRGGKDDEAEDEDAGK